MICFLDRDGIVNVDYGHVGTLNRFEWNREIFHILIKLKAKGYTFVLITNQSGIGRGYYTYKNFIKLSFYMLNYFYDHFDIQLEINFCPHKPEDKCICRKPSPSMMLRYHIGSSDIMIGDNITDMEAAKLAGISHRWLVSNQSSDSCTSHFQSLESLSESLHLII